MYKAAWLSHLGGVGPLCCMPKSLSKESSHVTSHIVRAMLLYSASLTSMKLENFLEECSIQSWIVWRRDNSPNRYHNKQLTEQWFACQKNTLFWSEFQTAYEPFCCLHMYSTDVRHCINWLINWTLYVISGLVRVK